MNDDADTERNKFRQAEYMKALKLKVMMGGKKPSRGGHEFNVANPACPSPGFIPLLTLLGVC